MKHSRVVKKILCFLSAVMLTIVGTICIIGAKDVKRMSTTQLDVSSNLKYSEIELQKKFSNEKSICLAKDKASDYSIVVPDNTDDEFVADAQALSEYLNKAVGSPGLFPVVNETSLKKGTPGIYLGNTAKSKGIDISEIKDDGYFIKSIEKDLYILTLDDKDIANGIYGFLEDVIGCMFVRDDFDYIPSLPTIYIDEIDVVSNPDFKWRKVFQYEVAQNQWYKKLKNNGVAEEGGIEPNRNWGTWCHSVFSFVDPKLYFEDHPEYYALVNGKRQQTQLCLTNEKIYPIIEESLRKKIKEDPEAKYWDFSLNDNYDYCHCENCEKVMEETGSMMGTMLPVINKLAKAFPEKIISTLAYFYNEKPPQGMHCEDNVNIVIAPIASGQLYSYNLDGSKKAIATKALVQEWSKVSKNILIWDYVVDFSHLLLPYPNFDVQKDNHQLYMENNVTAVFHQGSREWKDEMYALRSYTLSKQLWDNDIDTNQLIGKYLTVTYGKAAPHIAEYMDTMNKYLKEKAKNLDLYDTAKAHKTDYLSSKAIDEYTEIIEKAIESVKDDPVLTNRVEEIKINVLYARMTDGSLNYEKKKKAFDEFSVLVEKHKIRQPYEPADPTMERFIDTVYPKELRKVQLIKLSIYSGATILGIIGVSICLVVMNKKGKDN